MQPKQGTLGKRKRLASDLTADSEFEDESKASIGTEVTASPAFPTSKQARKLVKLTLPKSRALAPDLVTPAQACASENASLQVRSSRKGLPSPLQTQVSPFRSLGRSDMAQASSATIAQQVYQRSSLSAAGNKELREELRKERVATAALKDLIASMECQHSRDQELIQAYSAVIDRQNSDAVHTTAIHQDRERKAE